jgi:hypothetical protein
MSKGIWQKNTMVCLPLMRLASEPLPTMSIGRLYFPDSPYKTAPERPLYAGSWTIVSILPLSWALSSKAAMLKKGDMLEIRDFQVRSNYFISAVLPGEPSPMPITSVICCVESSHVLKISVIASFAELLSQSLSQSVS